ncbi:hypothetical protein F5Y07DRAFT_368558 [Xylaria sp. FL0933]|nr:hypothetical protein F5Y07DRAFT_368558 [Xylaria sp. FL0933]
MCALLSSNSNLNFISICGVVHSEMNKILKHKTQAQTDQIIKNLQRENTMIATAWYDLSSRLQSNHFVLQRRHEMPKSWLNKQRQLVNGEYPILMSTLCPVVPSCQLHNLE